MRINPPNIVSRDPSPDMTTHRGKERLHDKIVCLLLCAIFSLSGCHAALDKKARQPGEALEKIEIFYPEFKDDAGFNSLILAVERNIDYLERLDPAKVFAYGEDKVTAAHVLATHKLFLDIICDNPEPRRLATEIKRNFRIYRATGRPGNTKVLFTGYFEPVYEARLTPDDVYRFPIYRKPGDLKVIDLSLFHEKFKNQTIVARIENETIVPYYSRDEIDNKKVLKDQGLEIAWLKDELDVAFLQIQGSGSLKLPDGRFLRVGYTAKNGHPYRSIGKYLLEAGYIKADEMSMQRIRSTLKENPQILNEALNHNPSYVFFRVLEGPPLGSINIPVTPGRTIALDNRLFPKAALCFISTKKPIVKDNKEIVTWNTFSRFVLNQDSGGAITGAGRADIFWGRGPYAAIAAGHMRHEGELYLLIKKTGDEE